MAGEGCGREGKGVCAPWEDEREARVRMEAAIRITVRSSESCCTYIHPPIGECRCLGLSAHEAECC